MQARRRTRERALFVTFPIKENSTINKRPACSSRQDASRIPGSLARDTGDPRVARHDRRVRRIDQQRSCVRHSIVAPTTWNSHIFSVTKIVRGNARKR